MFVLTKPRKPAIMMAIFLLALSLLLTVLAALTHHQSVQAAPTATTLGGTVIVTDTVWILANSPYIITGVVSIQAGVVLTIEPGVIIQAAGSGFAVLSVEEGAHLAATGTPTLPITFTSVAGSGPGDWTDLVIVGSAHFNYTSFRNSYHNISLFGSTGGEVLVENSTISEATYGLESYANALHRLQLANVTFTNNVYNRIRIWASITGHELVDNVTLTAQPGLEGYEVIYENSGDFLTIPSEITLTLEAGTTLMMGGIYQLLVVDGHLQALGTPTMPVTITSANIAPGYNYYILFQGESIHFNHTVVQYADAAMVINSTDPNAEIFIENSIIRDSHLSLLIRIDALHQLRLENITFVNNVHNYVIIESYNNGALVGDVSLTQQNGLDGYAVFGYLSPIYDFNVPENITLTLEAGVLLLMTEDGEFRIDGRLQTNGTPTQPVTITSFVDTGPGEWQGLRFDQGEGHLQHTTVRYGESNISLTSPTATLYLSHTQVLNGLTGLTVEDGNVTAVCSTFANQQADGIIIANGGSPNIIVFSSNLFNNGGAGLNNSSGALVEARNNWWGDASGPGGIGPGNGDEISGTVAFDPWLPEPECLTIPLVTFAAPGYSVTEGVATAVLTLTLSFAPATTGTVNYATLPGTAVPGSDYITSTGSLTFTPGMTTAVIPITIFDDNQLEPDETLTVSLSSPQNLLLVTPTTAILTILDDDPALADLNVTLMASSSFVPVGGLLTYTVNISNSGPLTATAVSLTNQLPSEVTLLASPPNCTGTVTLTCSLDSLLPNHSLTLSYQVRADGILSGVITNSAMATAAELDIFPANNEATVTTTVLAPLVAFDSSAYSVMEGEETAVLTVSLNFAPATTVTVAYATLGGTAEPDNDYLPVSGTLTFLPGSTVRTVVIPIVDDGLVEGDETVLVALGAATNALLENDSATLTILDNDQLYRLYLPLVNKP